MTGTPIEQWEGCPDAMVRELKKLEFNYIEQLASAPDNLLQGIMGGATWRKKAQDYLERNKVTPEMVMNAQQAQIEELKQQVAALTSRRKSTE
jgi:polyhydroxyalkanoate synthesis regulator phasin